MPTGLTPASNFSPLVDESTTQQFMRGAWDATKKVRFLLEKMEQNGNIQNDGEGAFFEKKILVGEFQASERADLAARNFARRQHYITARAPWGFMDMTDVLSDRDLALNTGESAKVKLAEGRLERMGKDFKKAVSNRIFTRNRGANTALGIAASTIANGADEPINGLPTLFGHGSSTTGYSPLTGTTGTTIADADREALPNTTYYGQTTLPGGLAGVDNAITEAYSPVIGNWSSTTFDTAGASSLWNVNGLNFLDYMNQRLSRANDSDEMPDCGVTTSVMYLGLKQLLASRQRIIIDDSIKSPNAGMFPRRFIPYENITVSWDDDCTANVIYLLNSNKMYFKTVPVVSAGHAGGDGATGSAGEMFKVTQQHSIEQGGHLTAVQFIGQLVCEPRYQGVGYTFA